MSRTRTEFPRKIKLAAWEQATGHCNACHKTIRAGQGPIYDHIIPDAVGGAATLENCQVLCSACHAEKTHGRDVPEIAKTSRIYAKHIGAHKPTSRPMAGTKASGWSHKMNGEWRRR